MKLNLVLVGLVSVGAICGLDDYRLSSHAQEQPDSSAPITTAYEPSADPAANAAVTKLNPLLQNFAKQNPEIYGILLMADGDLETQKLVDAELIIDESQTAIDQKPILAVLNAELKPAQYQLKTTKHPAAKLLAEIQKRVTSTSELGNVQIQGIRYETNAGGGLTLKILGYRTANASTDAAMQLDALTTIATAAIAQVYAASELPKPNPNVADVVDIEAPSDEDLQLAQKLQSTLDAQADRFPQIFGRHVTVRRDYETKQVGFPIELVVDESAPNANAKLAPAELLDLAASVVPRDVVEPSIQPHPVSAVLKELHRRVAQAPQMKGVVIDQLRYDKGDDVTFQVTPSPWTVYLTGTVPQTSLRAPLETLGNAVLHDAYQGHKQPSPVADASQMMLEPPTVQDVLNQLAKQVAKDKALTGASVTRAEYVEQNDGTALALQAGTIAHNGQRDLLINAANDVLKQLTNNEPETPLAQIGNGIRREFVSASPYAEELQKRVEVHRDLGGCLIRDAKYIETADGSEVLEVSARISQAEQRDTLTQLGNEVVNDLYGPAWPRVQLQAEEVRPSKIVAAQMMDLGVNMYRRGNYTAAHQAFSRAILEDPNSLACKYWQIVTEIQLDRLPDAYRHLRPHVSKQRMEDNATAREYQNMLDSLESVQGPTRQILHQLENKARFEPPPLPSRDEPSPDTI